MSAVTLTVCFENPFWVGILEIAEGGEVRATRAVFGGEPNASQEAVRLEYEERKAQAAADAKERKAAREEQRYEAARAKRRARRRGH